MQDSWLRLINFNVSFPFQNNTSLMYKAVKIIVTWKFVFGPDV